MTAPPYDPREPELPAIDSMPRRMLEGASEDEIVWDLHDLGEPTSGEIGEGNRLGQSIDVNDDEDNGVTPPGRRLAVPGDVLTAANGLREALLDYGVRVSLELQGGASSSGYGPRSFVRNLSHHTVSRPSNGLTPCLSLVKRGRSDLAGPLCNG
jgi:hypothetical protein